MQGHSREATVTPRRRGEAASYIYKMVDLRHVIVHSLDLYYSYQSQSDGLFYKDKVTGQEP